MYFEVNEDACNNLSPPETPNSIGSGVNPSCFSSPTSSHDELDLGEVLYERHASFDEKLFELRRQSTEQLAAQMTLMDLELFKRIELKEFHHGNWMKKDKAKLSPNLLYFTKRFNHICFWVEREILSERNLKLRSDMLGFFIKLSKKLMDVNNLHGMMAVLSALQSAAIFRLSLTWKGLSRRERATYDKLASLTSTDDNHCRLREHTKSLGLPCIPHLGLYLTDMAYLLAKQDTHPSLETQRQLTAILDMISFYQNSEYEGLVVHRYLWKYLTTINFLDELEKFIVKDFFELSQELEPSEEKSNFRPCKSTDELSSESAPKRTVSPEESKSFLAGLNLDRFLKRNNSWSSKAVDFKRSPKHTRSTSASPSNSFVMDLSDACRSDVVVNVIESSPPTARKTKTVVGRPMSPLTVSGRSVSSNCDDHGGLESSLPLPVTAKTQPDQSPSQQKKRPFGFTRGHRKASSLGTNVLQSMGIQTSKSQIKQSYEQVDGHSLEKTVSLLDDSLLNMLVSPGCSGSEVSDDEDEYELWKDVGFVRLSESDVVKWKEGGVIKEGGLKRQVSKWNGKALPKPHQKKMKCTCYLTDSALIMTIKKRLKMKRFTSTPEDSVGLPLEEEMLVSLEGKGSDKTFVISNDHGFVVNFTAGSTSEAASWVATFRDALQDYKRRKQETSLIKL